MNTECRNIIEKSEVLTVFYKTWSHKKPKFMKLEFTKKTQLRKLATAAMTYAAFATSHGEKKRDHSHKKSFFINSVLIP